MPSGSVSRRDAWPHTWHTLKYSTNGTWKRLELSSLSQSVSSSAGPLRQKDTAITIGRYDSTYKNWNCDKGLLTHFFPKTIFLSIVMPFKGTLIHSCQQRPLGLMVNAGRPPVRRFSIFVRFVLVHCFLALGHFFRGRKDGLFCFIGFANTNGEGRSFLILSEKTTAVKQYRASPH